MNDNRRRYRAIKAALKQLYPTEPKGNTARHLNTLAALISGIVGSKSTQLPAIAAKVPDGTKRESRVKRFSRWVKNESSDAEVNFLPYADALLASLSPFTLLLAMDGSEAGRKCLALMVSIIYKKRALPLAWVIYLGVISKQHGWVKTIHRTDRCDLSLFQLGLDLIEHFLNEHLPIPVEFQMPRLAESVR